MADKKKSKDSGLFHLFVVGSLLFVCHLIDKVTPAVKQFLFQNKLTVSVLSGLTVAFVVRALWNKIEKKHQDKTYDDQITNGKGSDDSVFAGHDKDGKPVHINLSSRTMHAQVVGTTNAGKTESVIIPWAVNDISKRRGVLLLDGKSDQSLLAKIYAYVVKYNRQDKFKYFSLHDIKKSHTFNPLMGGSTEEIVERVFGAFQFDNEYYRDVQHEVFSQVLRIFAASKEVPTFLKLHQAISNPSQFKPILDRCTDKTLASWGNRFLTQKPEDRDKKTSGLLAKISNFAFGETAVLFNTEHPTIDIESALKNNEAVYFQLPVLKFPTLGKATGKLVLQVLQSAVSSRHTNGTKNHTMFSCYLDDFNEFLPQSFVSLLNKSRSAKVSVTFAHQALGDLKVLGPEAENAITVNSNLKVYMRTNEPDSAEYFARVVGTNETEKSTERQSKSMGLKEKTGEASIRLAEQFIHHPNDFKKEMGVGEAVVVIPHARGSKTVKMKFSILPDLKEETLPDVEKEEVKSLEIATDDLSEMGSFITEVNTQKEVA